MDKMMVELEEFRKTRPLTKFSEDKYLIEVRDYISATYNEHYANDKMQTFEHIVAAGYGEGFCLGSVIKYAARFGKKNGYNRKDLLKAIHYLLLELWITDNSKDTKWQEKLP